MNLSLAGAVQPPLVLFDIARKGENREMTDTETIEKPLDKMTAKELREVAKEIPEITGVHGMVKADLLDAIKKARGIEVEPPKPTGSKDTLDLKKKIQSFKRERQSAIEAKDKRMARIYKRRVSRLKKKTRRVA